MIRILGNIFMTLKPDFESQQKVGSFFCKINLKKVLHKSNIVCTFVMLSAAKQVIKLLRK